MNSSIRFCLSLTVNFNCLHFRLEKDVSWTVLVCSLVSVSVCYRIWTVSLYLFWSDSYMFSDYIYFCFYWFYTCSDRCGAAVCWILFNSAYWVTPTTRQNNFDQDEKIKTYILHFFCFFVSTYMYVLLCVCVRESVRTGFRWLFAGTCRWHICAY